MYVIEEQRRWKEFAELNDKARWQEKVPRRRNEEVRKPPTHVSFHVEDGRRAAEGLKGIIYKGKDQEFNYIQI